MRITCPNCGAQYEVDDSLIPDAGRDVQCSNCGKGWFQPKHAAALPAEDEDAGNDAAAEVTEAGDEAAYDEVTAEIEEIEALDEVETTEEVETVEEIEIAEEVEVVEEIETAEEAPAAAAPMYDDEDDEPEAPAAGTAMVPRKPDESVLSVLREEAQREIAQRRQETVAMESQPDLGLAEPAQRRGGPTVAETAAASAVAAGARRDLLPDIDVINSTLRSDADRTVAEGGEDEEFAGEQRRGFRTGFGLMLLVAAALIALYMGAGWLARTVPALEPLLIVYVDAANALRAWIDGLLAAGVDGMSG